MDETIEIIKAIIFLSVHCHVASIEAAPKQRAFSLQAYFFLLAHVGRRTLVKKALD